MKRKPIGIIAILVIIGVAGYFVINSKKTQRGKDGVALSSNATDTSSASTNQSADDTTSKGGSPKFNYIKEKVENGTLYGVVEVGASGFNAFVINMDNKKRWEIVSKDFGKSLIRERQATTEAIKAGMSKYSAAMLAKGVDKNNIHFVFSSGAQKEAKTTSIIKELRSLGYVVNTVTPEQEAKFALRATLPTVYYDNSFMVDMGSGNTKVSWDEEGNLKSMELPGSRYGEKGIRDADVYNEVKAKMTKLPAEKGDVCFIIGGVPKTLAEQHRKGEERYTVLKAPQDYKSTDKKMTAGLNIYKGILDGTQTDTYVFDWDANFSIGFLMSKE